MDSEVERLCTFRNWPYLREVWPSSLARAGFYYVPAHGVAQCYSCNLRVADRDWRHGFTPRQVHIQRSPNCAHINNNGTNVPFGSVNAPTLVDYPNLNNPNYNINDANGVNVNSIHNQPAQAQLQRNEHETRRNSITDQQLQIHAYPDMADEVDRLETFQNWPVKNIIDGKSLAKVGLFYQGDGDRARCFHCRIVLRHWEPGDDPLKEHLKFSQHCQFAQELLKRQNTTTAADELEHRLASILSGNDIQLSQSLAEYTRQDATALLEVSNLDHIRHYKLSKVRLDIQ